MNAELEQTKVVGTAWRRWLLGLLVLAALFYLYGRVVRPWFLIISDQGGRFMLFLSPADTDGDGDLDVLVNNLRNPGDYEVYAGGTLWINQGGVQGGQEGAFTYSRDNIPGGWASSIADLDGDADPDLLAYTNSSLVAGLNRDGNFANVSWIDPPVIGTIQFAKLLTGDLNGDGRSDALVLGCCGPAFQIDVDASLFPNISWMWLNDTAASGPVRGHTAGLGFMVGWSAADAALADVDGDGDLDLLGVYPELEKSSPVKGGVLLLNDGAGNFSDAGQRLGGKGSRAVALGDLDGDGDPDALIGESAGISIWVNQGGAQGGLPGKFAAAELRLLGRDVRRVLLADLDRDGDLDSLVAGKARLEIWWNNGHAGFRRGQQSFSLGENQDATCGDFNGDGREDIFIAQYDKSIQVWFNDGEGGFKP